MKARVLLVDDEARVVIGLQRVLSRLEPDFELDVAESGAEALDKLARGSWDLIVSDQRMPKLEGTTLLAMVAERHPAIARILLSGNAEGTTALRALFRAHRFLCKPCAARSLAETCRDLLGYARAGTSAVAAVSLVIDRDTHVRARAALAHDREALVGLVAGHPTLAAVVLHTVGSEFLGSRTLATDLEASLAYLGHSGFERVLDSQSLVVVDDPRIAELVARARDRAARAVDSDRLPALLVDIDRLATADLRGWRELDEPGADAALLGLWGVSRDLVDRVARLGNAGPSGWLGAGGEVAFTGA